MSVSGGLNETQQEIISLLSSEIRELSENECPRLKTEIGEALNELLFEQSVQLEHIANALDMAGLSGLARAGLHLSKNILHFHQSGSELSDQQKLLISQWGPLFVLYLETLEQENQDDTIAGSIISVLTDNSWPIQLGATETQEISGLFQVSGATTLLDEQETLPEKATSEMCSLVLDDTVRPELLQGLLIELPNQILEFEKSLSRFMDTKNVEDLNQAQRIAHTIKGSANIVSVNGLANLMHYTEELLESIQKHWQTAPENFHALLEQVSDCLAACADYLNGRGSSPDDIEDTLNQLFYWLKNVTQYKEEKQDTAPNQTEEESPELKSKNNEPPKTPTEPASQQVQGDDDDESYHINIPGRTAQELLRLSGETQISHNQIGRQLEELKKALSICHNHQTLIKGIASDFEALVQAQNALRSATMKTQEDELDPLEMEQFNELHSFSHQLIELATDSYEGITGIEAQLHDLDTLLVSQNQLNRDHQQILLDMNLVPVDSYLPRFSRCVRQACRVTHKAATLELTGGDILVDNHVLKNIVDPIMHLLRNAVDHGLEENQEEREKLGKPAEGRIVLSFSHHGESIHIECYDDGRGLDYEKIFEKAVKDGLTDPEQPKEPQELNQYILVPGFSTRTVATQTSGRGVGLDVVSASIRELKGNLQITSQKNEGCRISITVPSSILTAHAIVVKTKRQHDTESYSFLSRAIEQIVYVTPQQIKRRNDGDFHLFEDEPIPVYSVNDLLGITPGEGFTPHALLLCRKTNDEKLFIAVDQIVASQELVVKSFNESTYVPPGVVGATIMGDGSVSPVIDIHSLPNLNLDHQSLANQSRRREQLNSLEQAKYKRPPAAMVVDDSLSARRSLSQLVTDMGMDVVTAKDGFDAIDKIQKHTPSLLIVDLEMPRMNGLELTSHLRSRDEYKNIPVIMITSRSTDRHRHLAQNAGVDAYLTKPWSEDELMQNIEKQIA